MHPNKVLFMMITLAIGANNAHAQQIFKVSQYYQHPYIFNPAAAGSNDKASVGASYRKMWSDIPGGPQTILIYGDKYFSSKKAGIGLVGYNDETGPTSRTGGQINISYSVQLGSASKRLMFGLGGSVLQYKIDKEALTPYLTEAGDMAMLAASDSKIRGDAAAGVYLKTNTISAGVSVQNLVESKLQLVKSGSNPEGKLYRHYYFMADYRWKTDEDNVVIPNVLVMYVPNTPADIEGGVRVEHKDLLWVGASYHSQQNSTSYETQGFSLFAGVKIDHKIAIGYAYDQNVKPLSVFESGGRAHELSLRYFFAN